MYPENTRACSCVNRLRNTLVTYYQASSKQEQTITKPTPDPIGFWVFYQKPSYPLADDTAQDLRISLPFPAAPQTWSSLMRFLSLHHSTNSSLIEANLKETLWKTPKEDKASAEWHTRLQVESTALRQRILKELQALGHSWKPPPQTAEVLAAMPRVA